MDRAIELLDLENDLPIMSDNEFMQSDYQNSWNINTNGLKSVISLLMMYFGKLKTKWALEDFLKQNIDIPHKAISEVDLMQLFKFRIICQLIKPQSPTHMFYGILNELQEFGNEMFKNHKSDIFESDFDQFFQDFLKVYNTM